MPEENSNKIISCNLVCNEIRWNGKETGWDVKTCSLLPGTCNKPQKRNRNLYFRLR